jgi:hypothetical protein
VRDVCAGEDTDHRDRLVLNLPHRGGERRQRVHPRTDHTAQLGLKVEAVRLVAPVHRLVVSDDKQDPPTQRVGKRAGGRRDSGRLRDVRLALDEEILAMADERLKR